jgi:hypothetical protein
MALQDIREKEASRSTAHRYLVKASATTINAGEWVIQGTGGDVEYVTKCADGSSTSDVHVGLAVSTSTNTASADGYVYVVDQPTATFVARPTTSANLASTIRNTKVTMDVTSGVFTIDENDTTNGVFLITDYDAARNEVYFVVDAEYHIRYAAA